LLVWLGLAGCATDATLKPFAADGCTDFPDGTAVQQTLWRACCREHDKAYWRGGSKVERRAADAALRDCVAAVGDPKVAERMLAEVRFAGCPYWPAQNRWGYGRPWGRGYQALTPEERAQAEQWLRPAPAP
jgi:hypothetical protein